VPKSLFFFFNAVRFVAPFILICSAMARNSKILSRASKFFPTKYRIGRAGDCLVLRFDERVVRILFVQAYLLWSLAILTPSALLLAWSL
jgi:hypothetical protein